jgi:hypothetical protein
MMMMTTVSLIEYKCLLLCFMYTDVPTQNIHHTLRKREYGLLHIICIKNKTYILQKVTSYKRMFEILTFNSVTTEKVYKTHINDPRVKNDSKHVGTHEYKCVNIYCKTQIRTLTCI